MMNIPQSLLDRAKKEREEEIASLKKQIAELETTPPLDNYKRGVCVYRGDPLWENALRVCLFTKPSFGGDDPSRYDGIEFYPWPSKYEGCWRINAFQWECHVSEEHVFKRWNNEPCDCYQCKKVGK